MSKANNPYRYIKPPAPKFHGDGFVGIFWITKDSIVIPVSCHVDQGRNDGTQIAMHGVTHQTSFKDGLKGLSAFPPLVEPLLKMKYDQLERGRVVYNVIDKTYEVTLSSNVCDDPLVREHVITAFHLAGCVIKFKVADRYARRTTDD